MKNKNYLLTLLLITSTYLSAIAGGGPTRLMNYQAVARNSSGNILANQNISIKISIEDASGGTVLYSESHSPTTNQFGLFTLSIGGGTFVSGDYFTIDWTLGNQWLKVEMDPAGGISYTTMGETQLLYVPYAMSAASAMSSAQWNSSGTHIYNMNSGNVGIGTNLPQEQLQVSRFNNTTGVGGQLMLENTWQDVNNSVTIDFVPIGYDFSQQIPGARITGIDDGQYSSALLFSTKDPGDAFNPLLERMRVNSNGNVGIGTNNPHSILDVAGNIQISNADIPMGLITEVGGTEPLLNMSVNFREQNVDTAYRGAAFRIDTRSGFPLFQWLTRPEHDLTELIPMALTEAGNLQISSAPDNSLISTHNLYIDNSNSSSYYPGIGMHDNIFNGDVAIYGAGAAGLNIAYQSSWLAVNASAFNVMSDVTMKKSISHVEKNDFSSYLAQIRNIEPITYFYNFEKTSGTGNKGNVRQYPHVGFTAQSLPSTVTTAMNEDPSRSDSPEKIGYNLSDMIGLSVVGIKALDKKQTDLETLVTKQQEEIDFLKNEIAKLKKN